ncbi:MAG TPA: hypothetical protein PLO37_15875 [Candidatus Hydrogenedentes bacterium]|nr:hypothetical protein [Candidatus Hydrogenedentota bacterium]HPG68325.1 hypothetical protein [Candidatus Hydrogenedentota bacterium]
MFEQDRDRDRVVFDVSGDGLATIILNLLDALFGWIASFFNALAESFSSFA